jgi:hypothetical protein
MSQQAERIVGEKHLLPSRMAVNLAFALDMEPPPVLISALNKRGQVIATAPMAFRQWHFNYITMKKRA